MSDNSSHSSHNFHSPVYTTSGSSETCYCLYEHSPHGPHDVHVPGFPEELLGTIDYPIEISSSVEIDPQETQQTYETHSTPITPGFQEDSLQSDSVEDVTEQMRQPGTLPVDPIEISEDSSITTPTPAVSPMYPSLPPYPYQFPVIPPMPEPVPIQPVLQGARMVFDYFRAFLESPLHDGCADRSPTDVMIAFYNGLRPEVQAAMQTHVYLDLAAMVNHAMNIELEQIRDRTTRREPGSMGNRGRARMRTGRRRDAERTQGWKNFLASKPSNKGSETKNKDQGNGNGKDGGEEG